MALGKENKNPYHVFFETICIATLAAEEDTTISFANHKMEELSGYSKEEIEGKKRWTEFVSEKDIDDVLHYHKLRRGNKTEAPDNCEFRFIDRDGNEKQVILMMDVIPGSNRSVASIVDITGRKQMEEALKESEGKYREILSTMEEGYYETDLTGNFVFFNDSLCTMLGYNRDELMRLSYKKFYKNPQVVFDAYNRVFRTGKPEKAVGWPVITKDGRKVFAEVSISLHHDSEGAPMGFRGVARDITDRRSAEEALQESEERYREILATMEEGYYETDLTGNITYCNDSIARLLGYTRQEFTGINYHQVYKDPQAAYRKFNQIFQSGQPEKALTMEMIRKDGVTVYGEFSVTPIKDREGHITGFRGIIRDTTERHRFEEQLKYLSMHDQLTDLYNRAYFENELNRLSGSREYPIAIVSVDLDGLKLVNDTLGHDQGDELLVSCARVLQNSLRSSDIITRVGGDEFAVILPCTDRETGDKIVNRIQSGIESFNIEQQASLFLSASIGIATADDENKSLKETFKEADDLMYRDKLRKGIDARSQVIRTLTATLGERDFMSEGHIWRLEELCLKTGKKINLSRKNFPT